MVVPPLSGMLIPWRWPGIAELPTLCAAVAVVAVCPIECAAILSCVMILFSLVVLSVLLGLRVDPENNPV